MQFFSDYGQKFNFSQRQSGNRKQDYSSQVPAAIILGRHFSRTYGSCVHMHNLHPGANCAYEHNFSPSKSLNKGLYSGYATNLSISMAFVDQDYASMSAPPRRVMLMPMIRSDWGMKLFNH